MPPTPASKPPPGAVANVVLVHGAFADGSGWRGVYDVLTGRGFRVGVVQNPLTSLAADVAATKRILDRQKGPTILVGHSYGGVVITEAGDHPSVAGLVYVAAFAPDVGEAVFGQFAGTSTPAGFPFEFLAGDFFILNAAKFGAGFGADLDPGDLSFMLDSQTPVSKECMSGVARAAWKTKPSWSVVAKKDTVIDPGLQRSNAARMGPTTRTTEVDASHLVFMSHPKGVADVIEAAALGAASATAGGTGGGGAG